MKEPKIKMIDAEEERKAFSKNKIEIGSLCVESSTADMRELLEVADKLLSKHKRIVLSSKKRPSEDLPCMFG